MTDFTVDDILKCMKNMSENELNAIHKKCNYLLFDKDFLKSKEFIKNIKVLLCKNIHDKNLHSFINSLELVRFEYSSAYSNVIFDFGAFRFHFDKNRYNDDKNFLYSIAYTIEYPIDGTDMDGDMNTSILFDADIQIGDVVPEKLDYADDLDKKKTKILVQNMAKAKIKMNVSTFIGILEQFFMLIEEKCKRDDYGGYY